MIVTSVVDGRRQDHRGWDVFHYRRRVVGLASVSLRGQSFVATFKDGSKVFAGGVSRDFFNYLVQWVDRSVIIYIE